MKLFRKAGKIYEHTFLRNRCFRGRSGSVLRVSELQGYPETGGKNYRIRTSAGQVYGNQRVNEKMQQLKERYGEERGREISGHGNRSAF